ncbi:hypothetical protein [Geodermatophilus sp. URMC 62]|uniref:hypothetical protein n=1 Tax=Geodermatophilus sp. URMC 62 TaxID=3423414 RepID=UPI00406D4BEB
MTALGGIAAAAATAVIVAFGVSGTLDSGTHRVSTSTAALLTDVAAMEDIEDIEGIAGITGSPTLRVSATSTGPAGVFIGVGPADAVAEYLSGVAVDRVTDLSVDPFRFSVMPEPGAAAASPPGEQDFWVASATSRSIADLDWPVQDGAYRLVVMNADGAPELTSTAQVQLELPNAFSISLAVLIGSGILAAAGVAFLVVALLRGRRRPSV